MHTPEHGESYVRSYCDPDNFFGVGDKFYYNKNGKFIDRSSRSGISRVQYKGLGVVPGDIDNDGDMDIYIANDKEMNLLFINNGINFSITSSDLKNKKDFLKNIRKAIKNGLSEKTALDALTIIPAKSLNLDDKIGELDKGFLANFLITSGPIFDDKTVINENWVKGQRHIVKSNENVNIDGTYTFTINDKNYEVKISNSLLRPKSNVNRDSIDIKSKTSLVDDWLSVTFFDSIDGKLSFAQISSKISSTDNLSGRGIDFNNEAFLFNIPKNILPTVVENAYDFGSTKLFGDSIPIGGMAGDQQSATIGQACFKKGQSKSTYGLSLIHI